MAGYTSPYGPKMRPALNIAGYPLRSLTGLGVAAGAFGGVALVAAMFLAESIPRVREDIFKNTPVIGIYYRNKKPLPASDSPF